MSCSSMKGVNLCAANATNADLSQAFLGPVDLRKSKAESNGRKWPANLKNTILKRANLIGTDLRGAIMDNADITDAKLTESPCKKAG